MVRKSGLLVGMFNGKVHPKRVPKFSRGRIISDLFPNLTELY